MLRLQIDGSSVRFVARIATSKLSPDALNVARFQSNKSGNTRTLMIDITPDLVRHLIATQFPEWAGLTIKPVARSGWDNRTFHLGDHLSVRLPSAARYAPQVEKEQNWLPHLARNLTMQIPEPIAKGAPDDAYPWHWSVYRWLDGQTRETPPEDLPGFAADLAAFLQALHRIDASNGPAAGDHNFHRGGDLRVYDDEARAAIAALSGRIDHERASLIWDTALASQWEQRPVWVHGDIAIGNLLFDEQGRLSAVIDFGSMGVGDPACDLVAVWTMLKDDSRDRFIRAMDLDPQTWARARGWALWKATITCVGDKPDQEKSDALRVLGDLIN